MPAPNIHHPPSTIHAGGILLLLLLLTACGRDQDGDFHIESVTLDVPPGAAAYVPDLEGPLRVLSATPSGTMAGMAPEQAVAVTFSKPMVPLGETPPVPEGTLRLDPPVPGTTRWEGTQTLIFQPEAPLPLATAYTARLAAGLTALSGDRLDEPVTWEFETPRPILVHSDPPDGERFAEPGQSIRLRFDQRIRRTTDHVLLRPRNGQRVRTTVEAAGDSTLLVRPAQPLEPATIYELLLLPGLPSAHGPLGLRDTTTVRFTTYGPLELKEVAQPRPAWEPAPTTFDPERGVALVFTTPVRFGELRQALSFSPEVDFAPGIEARDDAVSEVHTFSARWQPETQYSVTVRNLQDQFGQRLASATETFRTRAYEPSLRVHDGILVIEADEQTSVPVRATNVEAVQLGMVRLSAEQIIPALRVYDTQHYYGEQGDAPEARPIEAARRHPLGLQRNHPGIAQLRLDSLLRGGTGVVALRVVAQVQRGQERNDHRAVAQVTRLGLTAKFSAHRNLVLVTDLRTAEPVAGAAVTIRDRDNVVRWQGVTGADGRAETPGWSALGIPQAYAWDRPAQFAFAERDGDLAFTSSVYMEGLEPYRFDLDYNWWPEPRIETGSVFSDRGLYRAGETVNLKAILRHRTDADWEPITDSTRILIVGPRDQITFDRRVRPSELGTFDLSWDTPPGADQGIYNVRVVHAADTAAPGRDFYEQGDIARGWFRVDAFRRATFAVTARTAAPEYVAGDFFEGTIEGRYLFGASMAGQPVRYSLMREPGSHSPAGYDGYRFGGLLYYQDGPGLYQMLAQADSMLDAEGMIRRGVQLPGNEAGAPAQLIWSGAVEDPSRQEHSARTEITLHPGLFYIGLKPRTTFVDLSRDKTMSVDVVTVEPGGRPVSGRAIEVELVRQQWNSVREVGADGRLRWRSERTEERVGRQRLTTEEGKAARLTMNVPQGGSYLIRASGRDVRGNAIRTEAHFYAAGSGYVAWERADDDRIEIVPERTNYRPGETARIMVQSPYEEATALITVEREGVISSRVETLRGSAPSVEIALDETHLPNIFVSVVLLHGRAAQPGAAADVGAPGFKIGYASLRVDPGERHLSVEVTANRSEYRPGDEVTVQLHLKDRDGRGVPGEIVFSAADAGVLNLIGYTLPDPFETFYGPRALGVTTSESRANLIEQRSFGQKEQDIIGGGGDASDMMRRDFRPLAHWAPAVQTDGRGRATVTFRLPESLTTFRLMATGLSRDHRFGAGRTDVTVSQPLVLLPALPRFARLDDRFEAGVLITNLTGSAGEAVVTAAADGIDLDGPSRQTVRLDEGETREVRFRWNVSRSGEAQLRFEAQLGAERDAFTLPLDVTMPAHKQVSATFASTDDAAREALRLPGDGVDGLGRFEVRLSSTALSGLDGAARYLFTYPYGCLEQITSAVRPLLLGDELLASFDLTVLDGERREVVEGWLSDLNKFWLGNGFSMWPGERFSNTYTGAYVVLALAEARAAGFAIPADLTREAIEGLDRHVRNAADPPEYYNAAVWDDTRALMLYALARHGRILEGEISTLAGRGTLSVEGESLLLRAIVLSGRQALRADRDRLLQRLRDRIRVEGTAAYLTAAADDAYRWIFSSDTRATAFGLAALVEADPSDDTRQLAQRMVRHLMQTREGGRWASTQDNAAVVDAFRAFFAAYEGEAPDFAAEVRLAGQSVIREQFRGRSLRVAEASRAIDALTSGDLEITKQGPGTLYYSMLLETYSRAPQPAARNGIGVERRIQRLDSFGQPVGEAVPSGAVTLQAGDLVRITLRITTPTDRNYVVIDDALPAGLEALNAAFDTVDREQMVDARGRGGYGGYFNHTEIRDDRVLLFADYLWRGEHTYTYLARATTPGTFVHPPVHAEMMYRPEVFGRTASGTVVVEAPGRR